MEVLKSALEWAKDEVFSSYVFVFFGVLFLVATIGFWQLGKSDVARAFIYPTLVVGALLLVAGIGMVYSNNIRLANFESEYHTDQQAFIKSEIERTENTMASYSNVALKVFPVIIIVAALLILFVQAPIWRAIGITTMAFMIVMIGVDINANERVKAYHKVLIEAVK